MKISMLRSPTIPACLVVTLIWLAAAAQAGSPATVSGTISEAGSGTVLANVTVAVSDVGAGGWGNPVAVAVTDASGEFSVDVAMEPGQSRDLIVEAAGPGHAPGRFNGSSDSGCYFNCGGTSGSFPVAEGDSVTDIDFSLQPGGTISGTISRESTGAPIEGASVELRDSALGYPFSMHFQASSDSSGNYQTPLAVAPGDYHLLARGPFEGNFVAQAWQGYSCQHGTCPILDTDTVELQAGVVLPDIDFALRAGARISGELVPDNIVRFIRLFDGAGIMLDQVALFASETEWSFKNLSGGSYYIELGPATGVSGHIRKLHNGLLCPFSGCDRARGVPITIPPGSSLGLEEDQLQLGGQIQGTIVDADTGLAPAVDGPGNIGTYDIIDSAGTIVGGGAIQQSDGDVILAPSAGLPPGSYFVRTYNNWIGSGIGYIDPLAGNATLPGYTDAMYPDIACAGQLCDLDAATPVTVTAGNTTSITIEISTGSKITGNVVDDGSDEPIERTIVKLIDDQHRLLATVKTDPNGGFDFGAFPAGSYYLRTAMSSNKGPGTMGVQHPYFDRVYGASDLCSEQRCDPTTGATITLDGSNDAGPFELRVESGPVITGRIIFALTGLLINNGYVEVTDANGSFVGRYRINHQTGRYQTTALSPGDYTLVPMISPAFSDVTTSSMSPAHSPAGTRAQRSGSMVVTVGNESVEADLQVIDDGIDKLFNDRFSEE
jgi:hypothetical protein